MSAASSLQSLPFSTKEIQQLLAEDAHGDRDWRALAKAQDALSQHLDDETCHRQFELVNSKIQEWYDVQYPANPYARECCIGGSRQFWSVDFVVDAGDGLGALEAVAFDLDKEDSTAYMIALDPVVVPLEQLEALAATWVHQARAWCNEIHGVDHDAEYWRYPEDQLVKNVRQAIEQELSPSGAESLSTGAVPEMEYA